MWHKITHNSTCNHPTLLVCYVYQITMATKHFNSTSKAIWLALASCVYLRNDNDWPSQVFHCNWLDIWEMIYVSLFFRFFMYFSLRAQKWIFLICALQNVIPWSVWHLVQLTLLQQASREVYLFLTVEIFCDFLKLEAFRLRLLTISR